MNKTRKSSYLWKKCSGRGSEFFCCAYHDKMVFCSFKILSPTMRERLFTTASSAPRTLPKHDSHTVICWINWSKTSFVFTINSQWKFTSCSCKVPKGPSWPSRGSIPSRNSSALWSYLLKYVISNWSCSCAWRWHKGKIRRNCIQDALMGQACKGFNHICWYSFGQSLQGELWNVL